MRKIQEEQAPWVKHNFGDRPSYWPLLGVVEEIGELCHAHLKAEQGIRTDEDHAAMKADAVGDIVIFLADYCSAEGIDLQSVVEETWDEVKLRDWKANAANAAEIATREKASLKCEKCNGCGKVADTEDQEPWKEARNDV